VRECEWANKIFPDFQSLFIYRRKSMRMQRLILGLLLTVLLSVSLFADTVFLRNGSVIQGSFLRFENGEIFIQLTGGGDRDRGRVLRFAIKEVLRIVTDRDPDGTISNASAASTTSTRPPARTNYDSYPVVNVPLSYDWINSNIQVTQGQRIRIEATGTVTLDGRDNSSPQGMGRRDPNAPLPEEADGALIASIGNDINIPILMIGKSKEFVADRDGLLYFSVNHYDINNTRGSYNVTVTTERRGGAVNQNPRVQVPVAPVSPFKCGLPTRFRGNENGFTTIWTRIGNSNEYNAQWSNGKKNITGVITVTTEANRVMFRRVSSSDGVLATYDGTVGADGVSIYGRVSYSGAAAEFSATAECY
jgi:hypothetical protein